MTLRAACLFLAAPLLSAATPLPPTAFAQDATAPPAETAAAQEPEFQLPVDIDAALTRIEDLSDEVETLSDRDGSRLLESYVAFITQQEGVLASVRATEAGTPEREREAQVEADLQSLQSAAESLVKVLAAKGVDVGQAREKLDASRKRAAEVASTNADKMTREEALDVDLEVLRAQLRPMTREMVETELAAWLTLLQETCVAISKKEIAGLKATGDREAEYNEEAVELRLDRGLLIDRVKAVMAALTKKGGDASEAKAFVSSVVATPPVTGFRAAIRGSIAWIKSPDGGIAVALEGLKAILVIIAAVFISRILSRIVSKAMGRVGRTSALLREFVVATSRRGTVFIGLLIALSTLGVNMGPLLAAIGAAGLVLGLALQGTLGNLASGIMIMVFRPFDVQDVVKTGGASGKVLGMSLMTTTVRTFDNQTIHVPNSMIWGDVITNVTANTTRRVDMVFGIGYADDTTKAREVLEKILASNDKVLADPEPIVRMHELGDSSVNFVVRPWSKTVDYWDVYWEVTEAVKAEFDAQGISIPFPQRDVHLIPVGTPEAKDYIVPPPSGQEKATTEAQQEVTTEL